ncbi:MAG: Rrf2 family transcriptional regulator [Candidatus Omnitrophica bacterium]|nr:Rrf2 family transcriptional regulator [Candidatus Omnitrophota bacterium]
MNVITRHTDYAIRAILYVAKAKGAVVSTTELQHELQLPRPFMRKIFQILKKEGILKSLKGNKGGFLLAQPPEKLLLVDIMRIFQGGFSLTECFLKKHICPNIKKCALRKRMKRIEGFVNKEFKKITIATLLKG